jgi:hypothetical protein
MNDKTKLLILWLCDLKCSFHACINLLDKERPRVEFEKSEKHYSLEQVFEYWEKNIFGKV